MDPNGKVRIFSRKQFSGKTLYEYCPYCVEAMKKVKMQYEGNLAPLWKIKTVETMPKILDTGETVQSTYFDEYCQCEKCARHIDANTMIMFYGAKPDGTSYRN